MEYACLAYDVPLKQRSLYNKLHKRIRGIGLPMTSSVYLIPLGARSTVQSILNELESESPNVIESCIIKFDDSEEKVILEKAQRALSQIIRRTKESVIKKLEKAEKEQNEAVSKYNELLAKKEAGKHVDATVEDLNKYKAVAVGLYENIVKQSLKKAENSLKEGRKLAVLFNMTNNMEAGFQALEGFVKQKWELIDVKLATSALAEVD